MKTKNKRHFVSYRCILILLLTALVILLIPMLMIAQYDVPAADDFSFSCETHAAVRDGGSLLILLAGAAKKTRMVYDTWQGSFAAVFLMAFQPAIWGLSRYGLTTWLMVLSLIGGIFFFFHRLMHGVFGVSKTLAGIMATVVSIACTQFLPSPNQSFYWYNGAVYYTFTFAVLLVLFSVIIGYLLYGKWWRIGIAAVLGIVIGGSNYITALFACICEVLLLAGLIWKKDKRWSALLLPTALLFIAFAVSIRAPGNAVRQGLSETRPDALKAILQSFLAAGQNALHWMDLRFAACVLFLLPFLWNGAKQSGASFALPGAVSAFSFCLFASLFTPHLYALGSDGPDRLKNILYFAFLIFSVLNLFWWLGWISRKRAETREKENGVSRKSFCLFSVLAALCLAGSVLLFHGTITSVAALSELRSGDAQHYYIQATERQIVLEDPGISECEFRPFDTKPYILYFTDMTDDPTSYENEDTATFYGKDSIVVKE